MQVLHEMLCSSRSFRFQICCNRTKLCLSYSKVLFCGELKPSPVYFGKMSDVICARGKKSARFPHLNKRVSVFDVFVSLSLSLCMCVSADLFVVSVLCSVVTAAFEVSVQHKLTAVPESSCASS